MKKLLVVIAILAAGNVTADPITVPNIFVSGEKAVASDVNDNFDAVVNGVNTNEENIAANTESILEKQISITGECAENQFMIGIKEDGTVNCAAESINSLDAGISSVEVVLDSGILSNVEKGVVTLDVDDVSIQRRATGKCLRGTFIKEINQDGTFVCGDPVQPTSAAKIGHIRVKNAATVVFDNSNFATEHQSFSVDFPTTGTALIQIHGRAFMDLSSNGTPISSVGIVYLCTKPDTQDLKTDCIERKQMLFEDSDATSNGPKPDHAWIFSIVVNVEKVQTQTYFLNTRSSDGKDFYLGASTKATVFFYENESVLSMSTN